MNHRTATLAAALCAVALAAPSIAQNQLCTFPPPWASNNGGTAGGVVMFDMNVTAAFLINSIDCNCSATANTAVSLEIYTTPGSYVGNEANPAAWSLVAQDTGGVLSAARNSPTSFTLTAPLLMSPGSYGIGIRVIGSGQAYTGTGSGGTPLVVSDSFMTITTGAACSALFAGSQFSIRSFNGCINYTPGSGLFASFNATPTAGNSPLFVNFTDTTFTSDPNGVQTWAWDFENDGTDDLFTQNPQWIYAAPGLYSVKLTVTDTAHPSSTITQTDYISVDPVGADFTASPTFGVVPLIVNFTDTSTGPVTSWAWDFENDGIDDAFTQNPTWLYPVIGQYSVKLTVSNSGQSDTVVKTNLIYVSNQAGNPGAPDILQYQFNEPRGTAVANTGSGPAFPAFGTARAAGWQGDPGRPLFNPNEPGLGELAYDATNGNSVDTGAGLNLAGSFTICWWAFRDPASTATSPFGYFFSDGSFRCFMGSAGILFVGGSGSPLSATNTFNFQGHLQQGIWNHYAIVVDDIAGSLNIWENGIPHGTPRAFTPGTYAYTTASATNKFSVGATQTGGSRATLHFHMDDFRFYGRALSTPEILGAMASELPTASTFGPGCAGPGGVPTIWGSGQPALGNGSFVVNIDSTEPGRVAAILLGTLAVDGGNRPLDVSFIFGPGCLAETLPDLAAFVIGVGPNNPFPLPIPNIAALAGGHVYAQGLVFGSSGAVTPALDINLQN